MAPPVPLAITFALMPVSFSSSGNEVYSKSLAWLLVVVDILMALLSAAAGVVQNPKLNTIQLTGINNFFLLFV
jgi:hypothetical protein